MSTGAAETRTNSVSCFNLSFLLHHIRSKINCKRKRRVEIIHRHFKQRTLPCCCLSAKLATPIGTEKKINQKFSAQNMSNAHKMPTSNGQVSYYLLLAFFSLQFSHNLPNSTCDAYVSLVTRRSHLLYNLTSTVSMHRWTLSTRVALWTKGWCPLAVRFWVL